MKNSVSSCWVVASAEATLCEGVCAAASRNTGGMGREHVGHVTSCAEGGTEPSKGSSGQLHLREKTETHTHTLKHTHHTHQTHHTHHTTPHHTTPHHTTPHHTTPHHTPSTHKTPQRNRDLESILSKSISVRTRKTVL